MSAVRAREEIDEAYTWDLESIFADDDEWETAFADAREAIEQLASYEGAVTDDAAQLRETLETYETVMRAVSTVYSYARMRRDEDTADDHYQALTSRAQTLYSRASAAGSYIEPEIQDASWEELEALIEADPELETYEHYLEDVHRMREHTRSAEVESVLADLGDVLGAGNDVYTMLSNADMTFPSVERDGEPVEITLANFVELQREPDRAFRQSVYEAFYDEWETVRNAVTASYHNSVKTDVKLARTRGYDTAREAALDGPNIPTTVYDTLVDTVRDHLSLLHRHVELKRQVLDVDELCMWDVYMPATTSEGPDISYDEAAEHVRQAVAPLGEEYQARLETGLESRWVDVYETPNKRSGAYSGGTYDTQPFILMNYQDTVNSMYTLAHEFGHSLHSEFTSDHQPYVYSSYEIFVAEVASTVNEALLTHHLLETVEDDHFRRHVLNQYLENFRSTLFRQTMFAEFEHRTHDAVEAGEALTADGLDELYLDLKADFYEPATVDDRIAREWMRIPHFYRAFYVYQYATGISAAVAIANRIIEEGESAAADYLAFLQRGSRKYPLELLEAAGVDMRTAAPIEDAMSVYDEYLDEMASLI